LEQAEPLILALLQDQAVQIPFLVLLRLLVVAAAVIALLEEMAHRAALAEAAVKTLPLVLVRLGKGIMVGLEQMALPILVAVVEVHQR